MHGLRKLVCIITTPNGDKHDVLQKEQSWEKVIKSVTSSVFQKKPLQLSALFKQEPTKNPAVLAKLERNSAQLLKPSTVVSR